MGIERPSWNKRGKTNRVSREAMTEQTNNYSFLEEIHSSKMILKF